MILNPVFLTLMVFYLFTDCDKNTELTNIGNKAEPNIILLFVDDYGWGDLGFRNQEFYTPNIDKLHSDAMEFSRAYISTPTCSPSRASILTGKESIRLDMPRHIESNSNNEKYNYWPSDPAQRQSLNWLPLEEITYAERLKELGYYNMFIGKWHLGTEDYHPIHQGFDEQYGTGNHGMPGNYYTPFFNNGNPLPKLDSGKYLTDVLTDKAEEFIGNYKQKKPFMLSLWYYNVHSPHIGRTDFIERYKKQGWESSYAQYGAMVSAMDESVGRIRKALSEKGIAENTVIIFTSDQGGYFSNYPLRGGKLGGNTLGEGGSRVPFIFYHPKFTKAGTVCETPIQTIDVYPTLVEIASGKECCDSQIQGKSIMPLLRNKAFPKRDLYFFRSYENQYAAIISGDWKLIKYHNGPSELYNLKTDPSELNNLVFIENEITKKLEKSLAEWEKEAAPPIVHRE